LSVISTKSNDEVKNMFNTNDQLSKISLSGFEAALRVDLPGQRRTPGQAESGSFQANPGRKRQGCQGSGRRY
jgi:hypothetical protein